MIKFSHNYVYVFEFHHDIKIFTDPGPGTKSTQSHGM